MASSDLIDMAPLQGFTDFVYRRCYHHLFGDVDEYYIPYIAGGSGGKIRNSQYREILPENNGQLPVVPQILCANGDEAKQLAGELKNYGYQKLNLNLGCPYPMATKRGRGTGLLENPDQLKEVLDVLFGDFGFKVSVKFRAGLSSERTIFERLNLLESYPFEKMIFHPRTANQLYKGSANRELFAQLASIARYPLVYNGDIRSVSDLAAIKQLVPTQKEWMIGRGLLANPFLVAEIRGLPSSPAVQTGLKHEFHQLMYENYRAIYADAGQVLMKMKSFWSYFAESFSNPHKAFKGVKKANSLSKYELAVAAIFRDFTS